jgi:hypothetical protein
MQASTNRCFRPTAEAKSSPGGSSFKLIAAGGAKPTSCDAGAGTKAGMLEAAAHATEQLRINLV